MSNIPVIYGINACDTVRKARKWLRDRQVEHEYHDFRKQGIDTGVIQHWIEQVGDKVLLNRRGTTWRQLPEDTRQLADTGKLADLLAEYPTLIKRPVLQLQGQTEVGFSESRYAELFG